MRYRADIDGLRAVAVLPILFYHLGIPPFTGGFVGVDIFFVISGYLITSIIQPDISRDRFSIARFYEKRAKRILPALFVMLFFCILLASLLFLPFDFKSFSKSLIGCVTFTSNFVFWQQANYFDAPAEIKPLLHTWSLAIEEQFYIVYPALLLLIQRWFRGNFKLVLSFLAVASVFLNVAVTRDHPSFAFFLIPSRAWELLLGALIALKIFPPLTTHFSKTLFSIGGIALIAGSIFALTHESIFPGFNAIYPCIGAALLIYTGEGEATVVSGVLSKRPIVLIGLISYSLYLWHWPIIVFYRYYVMRPFSLVESILLLILCFLAAIFSYLYVEQPFRRGSFMHARTIVVLGSSLIAAFGVFGISTEGWKHRFSPDILALDGKKPFQSGKCVSTTESVIHFGDSCILGAKVKPSYAIWGDSFGISVATQLGALLETRGQSIQQLTFGSCPPSLKFSSLRSRPCIRYSDDVLRELLASETIETVFVVAFYAKYFESGDSGKEFSRGFAEAVTKLAAGGINVVLIYPIPTASDSIPRIVARSAIRGIAPESVKIDRATFRKLNAPAIDLLDSFKDPNIARVRPEQTLCTGTGCSVYASGRMLYLDEGHLTLAGADSIVQVLTPFLYTSPVKRALRSARQ